MRHAITITLNGEDLPIEVHPNDVLLDVLRTDLGVKSPKIGCERGDCGSCTIIMDGRTVAGAVAIHPLGLAEIRRVLPRDGNRIEIAVEEITRLLEGAWRSRVVLAGVLVGGSLGNVGSCRSHLCDDHYLWRGG